jgi:hypothetical protein
MILNHRWEKKYLRKIKRRVKARVMRVILPRRSNIELFQKNCFALESANCIHKPETGA